MITLLYSIDGGFQRINTDFQIDWRWNWHNLRKKMERLNFNQFRMPSNLTFNAINIPLKDIKWKRWHKEFKFPYIPNEYNYCIRNVLSWSQCHKSENSETCNVRFPKSLGMSSTFNTKTAIGRYFPQKSNVLEFIR